MIILAVETSGYDGTVALQINGDPPTQRSLSTEGRRHAQTLVSEVDQLLRDHDRKPTEIDAVAVSIGPGSFTGLRVGVVFAKTFAWVNQAKLIAVNTLEAVAQRAPIDIPMVTVISDAQRKEVFLSDFTYDPAAQSWNSQQDVQIIPIQDVQTPDRTKTLWTGPGVTKFADEFDSSSCAEPSLRTPTASAIATIGRSLSERGETSEISPLEPLYIRRSYAEEKSAGQSPNQ